MNTIARTLLSVTLVLMPIASASAGAAPTQLPRTADGRPDLSGIWKTRRNEPVPRTLPYLAAAAATQAENFRERQTVDPLSKCFMPGVPRIMYLNHAFQIFQTPALIAVAFEWQNMYRVIYTNGTPHPKDIDFWMGDSRGRWEGDTLVVDVRNHNDRTWFDARGDFHSEDLAVVERYTLTGPDTIAYEATVEDAKVFTKPWTVRTVLQRQTAVDRLGDFECLADFEEAHGLFDREPRTWYPTQGAPAVTPHFSPEQELAATTAKSVIPAPAANAKPVRRMPDGTPDLQGYYAHNRSANFGLEPRPARLERYRPPSRGFVIDPPGGKLPVQPWAQALSKDRQRSARGYDDPAAHCYPLGAPRSIYVNDQQIVQTRDYVVFLFERTGFRIVPLKLKTHLPEQVRRWQGDSIGHWDKDSLVVDTTNFNGRSWLNEPDVEFGAEVVTWAEHLIERFTPIDATTLHYEATVLDPMAYTQPWTMALQMRQTQSDLLEVACKEDDQDLAHLKALKDAGSR